MKSVNVKLMAVMLVVVMGIGAAQAALTPVFEYSFPASYAGGVGAGKAIDDLSSAGNDATAKNADTPLIDDRPAGFDSSLMSVNGTNRAKLDTALLLDSQAVAAAGGFTIDTWLKWDGGTGSQKAIDYAGKEMLKQVSGKLYFMLGSGQGGTIDTPLAGKENTWMHVVAVFDTLGNAAVADESYAGYYKVDGDMSLYIDDVLIATKAATKTGWGDSSGGVMGINSSSSLYVELWNGAQFNPTVSLGVVPEPATMLLLGLGGLTLLRRRR